MATRRTSMTISEDVYQKLGDISNRLGITKSAIATDILEESIGELHKFVITFVPERGKSEPLSRDKKEIKKKLKQLEQMLKQQMLDFSDELEKF